MQCTDILFPFRLFSFAPTKITAFLQAIHFRMNFQVGGIVVIDDISSQFVRHASDGTSAQSSVTSSHWTTNYPDLNTVLNLTFNINKQNHRIFFD